MKRAAIVLLAALCASAASAKGIVVCDLTTQATYNTASSVDAARSNQSALLAVERVLQGWGCMPGVGYDVLRPSEAKTEFCRTGVVTHNYGSAGAWNESYNWVIHVGFNGSGNSQYTGYRPESLLVTGTGATRGVTVPQLLLLDGQTEDMNWNNAATDSTGLVSNSVIAYEHHAGCILRAYGRSDVFSDIGDGPPQARITSTKNGGMRSILSFNIGVEYTISGTEWLKWPDSTVTQLTGTTTDTSAVWEFLHSGTPLKRITFASPFPVHVADSTGVSYPYQQVGVSWPVLCVAIAHLDSLTGGDIIKKPRQFGFVVSGAGLNRNRRDPGGLFAADTTIQAVSCDSVRTTGAKIVVAAAPESLTAADAVRWKRAGLVRFTPSPYIGLDTLALGANGKASLTTPVDVWGRYRNRAFYGDSESHAVMGSDSSIYQLYKAARSNLASTVGSAYLSRLIVAPADDWSPYQMRRNQNAALLDSIAWVAAKLGCPAILTNTWGRDMDPTYLTNPKGWLLQNRRYTVRAASLKGTVVNFVGHQQLSVRGSRLSNFNDYRSWWGHNATDTTITTTGLAQTASNYQEYAFWSSLYGPWSQVEYNPGASLWAAGAKPAWDSTVYDNIIGTHQRASIFVLPAQSFGGQSATTPNRWGFWCIKHVMGAANLINYAAGRTVMQNAWPEDIVP